MILIDVQHAVPCLATLALTIVGCHHIWIVMAILCLIYASSRIIWLHISVDIRITNRIRLNNLAIRLLVWYWRQIWQWLRWNIFAVSYNLKRSLLFISLKVHFPFVSVLIVWNITHSVFFFWNFVKLLLVVVVMITCTYSTKVHFLRV